MTDFLDDKADRVKLQAFAPTTLKTRRSQWNRYELFCKTFDLQSLPVTPQNVCRFLVYIGDDLTYATLNNYVSALNALGRFHAGDFDLRKDYGVTMLLRGFRRLKGDLNRQKDPLLPSDLRLIFKQLNLEDPLHLVVWLIVLLAFRSLLRKSHFVCSGQDDQEHLLRLKDVNFEPWGCRITIGSSKTIQFCQRKFDIPINFSKEPLCAASLLRTYLDRQYKLDSELLFTLPGSHKPVPYSLTLDLLKSWCSAAGIFKDVGFHSLRRGSASFMHSLNIELVSIQKAGDWQSLCVLKYLTVDFSQKRKVEEFFFFFLILSWRLGLTFAQLLLAKCCLTLLLFVFPSVFM